MLQPPSREVTFLLSDVEGSTSMWERWPGEMSKALTSHDRIVAEIVERHGGALIKARGEGDSHFAVFEDATMAARAAADLQSALWAEEWQTPEPIRVRMALHTGRAEFRDDDYYGPAVNRAARLRAIGHGGQILVSGACVDRIATTGELRLIELGRHLLKDLSGFEDVFQLCAPGAPEEFPPLRATPPRRHNLPSPVTECVGRDEDIAAIAAALPSARLHTLVGPGGIGKTRLAIEVAAHAAQSHADGCLFVELAVVDEGELVASSIATNLGLREASDRPVEETLVSYLGDRELLLVLDNCEHVLEVVGELAHRLLKECPGMTILATSREPLRLAGEAVRPVRALSVPSEHVPAPPAGHESVRLFVARARDVRPDFALDESNEAAVAGICARLEGLPLAIELAAARVRSLSPAEIARRLDDRFRLLDSGARAGERRHRTMRATIEWSYDLLSERERAAFACAAVFSSPFTLAAAEAVCTDALLGADDVVDVLESLVERSLVIASHGVSETRYSLLETTRAFGLERLGDGQMVQRRHFDYFLALARQGAGQGSDREWREALESDYGNIRSALAWGLAAGLPEAASFAAALGAFWIVRGLLSEGMHWLAQALTLTPVPELRALLLAVEASILAAAGELSRAQAKGEEGLEITRALGPTPLLANILSTLGGVATDLGDLDRARNLLQEAIEVGRTSGSHTALSTAIYNFGAAAYMSGDHEAARAHFQQALAIDGGLDSVRQGRALFGLGLLAFAAENFIEAREQVESALALDQESGHRLDAGKSLTLLGAICHLEGDLDAARLHYEDALALAQETGDRVTTCITLLNLGEVALDEGDLSGARSRFEEARSRWLAGGDEHGAARASTLLGLVLHRMGDVETARVLLTETLEVARRLPGVLIGCAFHGFALLELSAGHFERAAQLFGVADGTAFPSVQPSPAEQALRKRARDEARAALGDHDFESAYRRGRECALDVAISFALREDSD